MVVLTLIPDAINVAMLIATSVMAILMYKTFKSGQEQTSISLGINQYHIYYTEFKDYVEEAKNLKFDDESDVLSKAGISNIKARFDGLNYIPAFLFLRNLHENRVTRPDEELIDGFRFGVLFPLTRYYDRLFEFLQRIQNDEVLSERYKKILFMHAEKDLLQNYFRICNYTYANILWYNIEPLKTQGFDYKPFYHINDLYIQNNLFQFKSLDFYKTTT